MVKCQHEGCQEEANVYCYLPDNHEFINSDYQYCVDHASIHGFCYCCGQFWGGIERFDFARSYGGVEGLCENCDVEVRDALGELDEDDEDPYYCYYEPDHFSI